jgi:hypothetical protein
MLFTCFWWNGKQKYTLSEKFKIHRQIIERNKIHTPNTHVYLHSLSAIGKSWPWSYGSWISNYICNQCISPPVLWVRISIRVMCIALCDKVLWFSPGPLFSSTNKTVLVSRIHVNKTSELEIQNKHYEYIRSWESYLMKWKTKIYTVGKVQNSSTNHRKRSTKE